MMRFAIYFYDNHDEIWDDPFGDWSWVFKTDEIVLVNERYSARSMYDDYVAYLDDKGAPQVRRVRRWYSPSKAWLAAAITYRQVNDSTWERQIQKSKWYVDIDTLQELAEFNIRYPAELDFDPPVMRFYELPQKEIVDVQKS